jgi:hypothetical protein
MCGDEPRLDGEYFGYRCGVHWILPCLKANAKTDADVRRVYLVDLKLEMHYLARNKGK